MISSISLPNWQHARLKSLAEGDVNSWLHTKYKMLLRYAARSHRADDRQMLYNDKVYSYKRHTVRWDAEMYNRLRMAAHRLRVSLSFLIHLVLLEKDEALPKSSYSRTDSFNRNSGLTFIEIIRYPYYPKPPDL